MVHDEGVPLRKTLIFILMLSSMVIYAQPLSSNFHWPMGNGYGKDIKITSPFGDRKDVILPGAKQGGDDSSFHFALDMIPKDGSYKNVPIYAAQDGIVVDVWPPKGGKFRGHPVFGGCMLIKHEIEILGERVYAYTFYAHLKEVFVSEGTRISQNTMIGIMGNTGMSTGAHLHFEIRFNPMDFLYSSDRYVDRPRLYLPQTTNIQIGVE